jgi:hypothetical protein
MRTYITYMCPKLVYMLICIQTVCIYLYVLVTITTNLLHHILKWSHFQILFSPLKPQVYHLYISVYNVHISTVNDIVFT